MGATAARQVSQGMKGAAKAEGRRDTALTQTVRSGEVSQW